MIKEVTYKGKKHKLELRWRCDGYSVREMGYGGFISIPIDCVHDIVMMKHYFVKAIEFSHNLSIIKEWDGNI